MNAWRTPPRVVAADCPDQIADIGRDRRPADTTARLPTPVQTEAARPAGCARDADGGSCCLGETTAEQRAGAAGLCGIDDEVVAIQWPSGGDPDLELENWLSDRLTRLPSSSESFEQSVSGWIGISNRLRRASGEIINAARERTARTWSKAATALRQRTTSPPSDVGAAALHRHERL
jgi:hypothetical protein